MSVTAPPRPPSSEPVDREELEALIEALFEEARQRARRRRRIYMAVAALVALAAVTASTILERTAHSQTASPAVAALSRLPAATAKSKIAFLADVLKPTPTRFLQTELYVMNADGSGKRRLVPSEMSGSPVWSPDGRKIGFTKRLGRKIGPCAVCHDEIFVMNADGGGQRNLTGNLGGGVPTWSPDGQQIAFSRTIASTPGLYVMNADGSGQRRVTQDAKHVWGATWSPDGQQLTFASGVQGNPGNFNLYVVNVDGSGLKQLTNNRGQDPAWSPDGQTIAFARYVRKVGGFRGWQKELYVMNADGSEERKLAPLATNGSYVWSPDGRRISFVSNRDGNHEVYVINTDGSGLRNLTRNPAGDGHPAWSPDGRKIGFVRIRGGNRDIYVMNADGSGQRNLTRDIPRRAFFAIAWSPAR